MGRNRSSLFKIINTIIFKMKLCFALLGLACAERFPSRPRRQDLAGLEPEAPVVAEEEPAAEDPVDPRRGKNQGAYGATGGTNYNTGTATGGSYGGTTDPAYPSTGLKCWHCDAMSFEECEKVGMEKTCHGNQGSCFLEIRERRNNGQNGVDNFMQICMGCKSDDACQNMKAQNFQNPNPDYTQCRPETAYSDSVCRQCCDTDNCTRDPSWWYPQSREEWDYSGEETSYGYKK